MLARLVSFTTCFFIELLLSARLVYRNIRDYKKKKKESPLHSYRCETIVADFLDVSLIAPCIAGILAIALRSRYEVYAWLDVVILYNLHHLAGTNLARILQILTFRRWTVLLAYAATLLIALDIFHVAAAKKIDSAYESALLARLAIASLLSLALARNQVETHRASGRQGIGSEMVFLMNVFIITNAAAALVQLCGATILSSLSLANTSIDGAQLRRGILLACTATQLLCYLPLFLVDIRSILAWIRSKHTRDHNEEGGTRLDSLPGDARLDRISEEGELSGRGMQ
ncbi:hypothetical protein CC86DRAFT_389138 [Ophiobolus disseminans]|uniref:Integral membrane protein n=1 Tax=Ophiobolus disseminans TaxID=1469910 RepID=A0A6A6ZAR9_9PLEO|nr:hypothetical protein CC86DRAFT_389138 [Ophiobolus disseminans]